MKVELRERMIAHVVTYWHQTQDEVIKKMLPTTTCSEKQAIEMFRKSVLPDANSYGKVIYVDEHYIGDIWCYGIDEQKEAMAMLSYCIFEKSAWGKGIATIATGLFLKEMFDRYRIEKIGAFTYATNLASIKVLEKQGFNIVEEWEENNIKSQYFEKRRIDSEM